MHSSQLNGMSVRRSNSPVARESRGPPNDYNAWKLQREKEYETSYHPSSAMDIDYPPASGGAGNPPYGSQPYLGGQPAYPPASYPPPVHAPPAQYPAQPPYGYPPQPAQYSSPSPQTAGDRYSAMPPPPGPPAYGQDPFIHGSNYQTAAGYATAGPARMPPPMPHTTAAPSRTFSAPATGTPVYGTEPDPYYPPPAGNPAAQNFPIDALHGRGAYATTKNPPPASSDDLGSPAGTTPRQGYPAVPEQYDDAQNPVLHSAASPANATPASAVGAPPPRRDRDRDSEPRERERDHRDHRARRTEPERDERHPDRNRHRHR